MNENIHKTPKLVRDLMTVGVTTCGTDTLVTTIAEAILEKDLEAIVVLDEEGHALGVVSQDELINAYGRENYPDLTAEDILHEGIPQIPTDIPLRAAAQMMRDDGIRAFFLMHHAGGIGYPAAVITYKHFLRHMTMKNHGDIKDLGIGAEREPPLNAFIKRRDAKRKEKREHD
jgi:predicted transcriptional regulator